MIENLFRKNILSLKAYSAARTEDAKGATLLMDANELPFDAPWNRYPDPYQSELRRRLAENASLSRENVIVGNGSDELIDIIVRSTCEPGQDKVLYFTPGYGMYKVTADICGVEAVPVPLDEAFQIEIDRWKEMGGPQAKVTFICSPNNPTGNDMDRRAIRSILESAAGLVVVDEAYIQFSEEESLTSWVQQYPNLMVIQTFSKAFGLAALRVGVGYGNEQVIAVLDKVKPPYNVNAFSQKVALEALEASEDTYAQVELMLTERKALASWLEASEEFIKVYPSSANFILTECRNPESIYEGLLAKGIKVRKLIYGPDVYLRFSVGTPAQNTQLKNALKELKDETSTVYR